MRHRRRGVATLRRLSPAKRGASSLGEALDRAHTSCMTGNGSMCRFLGILAEQPRTFSHCLLHAPRSLASLSGEHSDGWGLAAFDASSGWQVERRAVQAVEDPWFADAAMRLRGSTLVGHVRRRTIGAMTIDNTHPFRSGRWVFAHNGTIVDLLGLKVLVSASRASMLVGQTDSEVLFAYFLTQLDEHALTEHPANGDTDTAIARAVEELRTITGSINFLLSDGITLYAFRRGRDLHVLERSSPGGPVHEVLVASEPITMEPWTPVAEQTLVVVRRTGGIHWFVQNDHAGPSRPDDPQPTRCWQTESGSPR